MIPCKKCLVLSTCKNRKSVSCDKLHEWVIERKDPKRTFKIIRQYFVDGIVLSCSQKRKDSLKGKKSLDMWHFQEQLFKCRQRERKKRQNVETSLKQKK